LSKKPVAFEKILEEEEKLADFKAGKTNKKSAYRLN